MIATRPCRQGRPNPSACQHDGFRPHGAGIGGVPIEKCSDCGYVQCYAELPK
jgi:hypothetical protein